MLTNAHFAAKEFYSQVFGWSFKPGSDEYPEDRIAMFEFPDPRVGAAMVEGGITKQEDTKRTSGGVVNYLYVDSIEETAGVGLLIFSFNHLPPAPLPTSPFHAETRDFSFVLLRLSLGNNEC